MTYNVEDLKHRITLLELRAETAEMGWEVEQVLRKELQEIAESVSSENERIRKMIEDLRMECKLTADSGGKGHDDYSPNEVAELIESSHYIALTKILEGTVTSL